jgi:hypothetical protein
MYDYFVIIYTLYLFCLCVSRKAMSTIMKIGKDYGHVVSLDFMEKSVKLLQEHDATPNFVDDFKDYTELVSSYIYEKEMPPLRTPFGFSATQHGTFRRNTNEPTNKIYFPVNSETNELFSTTCIDLCGYLYVLWNDAKTESVYIINVNTTEENTAETVTDELIITYVKHTTPEFREALCLLILQLYNIQFTTQM